MQQAPDRGNHTSWRLPLAVALVLVVVVVPVWLQQRLARAVQGTSDLVAHTHAVEAAAAQLAWTVREAESAALLQVISGDVPLAAARIRDARREVPAQVQALAHLTRDNASQQLRIGRLSELIEARFRVIEQIQAAPQAERAGVAMALVDRVAIRGNLRQIMQEEQRLMVRRTSDVERQRRLAAWFAWGAMAAQLLLLGLVGWLLLRQVRQRLQQGGD